MVRITAKQAPKQFGFLAPFVMADNPASSDLTRTARVAAEGTGTDRRPRSWALLHHGAGGILSADLVWGWATFGFALRVPAILVIGAKPRADYGELRFVPILSAVTMADFRYSASRPSIMLHLRAPGFCPYY
ncbi:MAG TPA: hypothetical protein VND19_23540, partial [Acetobacteraceae bacterium]|nr:hypothetical protein [Acetobacteraceae bacterium]